ncbi:MAG: hypothetical protein KGL15_05700 [Acidobacteriota bacterium]|nr:hypothetical protein [Acidobacteriota bacterium]
MRRLLTLSLLISSIACCCAAGLAAPAALAAGSGATTQPNFSLTNGGAAPTPQTTTASAATTASSSSSGLSGADAAIIAVVGVLVLGGLAFWIWYDARGHAARVGHGHDDGLFGQRAHAGSKAPRKPRKLTLAERKRRKRGRAR